MKPRRAGIIDSIPMTPMNRNINEKNRMLRQVTVARLLWLLKKAKDFTSQKKSNQKKYYFLYKDKVYKNIREVESTGNPLFTVYLVKRFIENLKFSVLYKKMKDLDPIHFDLIGDTTYVINQKIQKKKRNALLPFTQNVILLNSLSQQLWG